MIDSYSPHTWMGACTRRIAAAPIGTKASSLATDHVDHAAWCRPSPRTRGLGINHLAPEPRLRGYGDPNGELALRLDLDVSDTDTGAVRRAMTINAAPATTYAASPVQ